MKEGFQVFKGIQALFPEAMAIRTRVFVEEQHVPVELERDEYDELATHLLLFKDGAAAATGRIFPDPQHPGVLRLGRIAVLKPHRGQGVGGQVVSELLKVARNDTSCSEVVIHAQQHLVKWYSGFGFKPIGDEFLEAGIRHQEMVLRLK